jgi:hypothetical protein
MHATCATPLAALAAELHEKMKCGSPAYATFIRAGDKVTIKAYTEQDSDTQLTDSDFYGTLVIQRGRGPRPHDVNGNAEVVHSGRYERVWWQPYDGAVRGTEQFDATRKYVRGWFNNDWTYETVWLEVTGDRRSEDMLATLGGVESDSGEYIAEVLEDQLVDCGITMKQAAKALENLCA